MALLITSFDTGPVDEARLDNLTMWLDQQEFKGFKRVDYRFEHSAGSIHCCLPEGLSEPRLTNLCEQIDAALARIVPALEPRTTVH